MEHFSHADAAERYVWGRPYFHTLVVRRIAAFLNLQRPVAAALDVGCGTGLSTVAMTEIASRAVGTDTSTEMLARAPRLEGIEYVEASAEDLPFAGQSFDLVSVSSAFHWFDRARFLAEARRVLPPTGWLVIYDNAFRGKMRENPEFEKWFRKQYMARYPSPPRDRRPFGDEDARPHGFRFLGSEEYGNDVRFSVEELARYLETQSNVIAAVEEGLESIGDVHEWLQSSLAPLFRAAGTDPRATFVFGGYIWYLRSTPS